MRTLRRLADTAGIPPSGPDRAGFAHSMGTGTRPPGLRGGARRWVALACLIGTAILAAAGCSRAPDSRVLGYRQSPGTSQAPTDPKEREREMRGSNTLAGRQLSDDLMVASEGMLGDAYVLDEKNLYVRLGSKAEPEIVPDLIQALVLIMHERFPEKNVVVHLSDRQGKPMLDASLDVASQIVTYTLPSERQPAPAPGQ